MPQRTHATIDSPGDSRVRLKIVALLMAFSFTNYMNRLCMAVAGDSIRATYGIGETTYGTILSALVLGYTLCMLPGGWLSDRFGSRRALACMGFGTALCCAATALLGWTIAASQTALMVALLWLVRAGLGACTSPLYPAAGRSVSRWIPFAQRARVNALVTGVASFAIAASYPVCGFLIDHIGWPATLLIWGAATAAVAGLWVVLARDAPHEHPAVSPAELELIGGAQPPVAAKAETAAAPAWRTWRALVANRSLCLLTLSYACMGYVEYLVFYWSESYFKNVLALGSAGGRAAAMIPPLCMGFSMPAGGWLCDRLLPVVGYRRCRAMVAGAGMVGCGLFMLLATCTANQALIVACFALALASVGITEGPAWATAIDLGGRHAATSAAIANTGGNAGGALSPTLTPWISALVIEHWQTTSQTGWAWGMRVAGAVCLAGAVMWRWIDASQRPADR